MRKKLFLLVAILVCFAVLGGSAFAGGQKEGTGTAEKEKKEGFVLGYDIYYQGNAWSLQMAEEFKYAVQDYIDSGVVEKVHYTSSDGDITKQLNNFDDLITKGCDAIFISPNAPDALVEPVRQAEAEGIKVIVFAIAMSGDDYTAYVNVSDKTHGAVMAQWMADELGGKGKVALINGIPGTQTAIDVGDGVREVVEEYPEMELVQEVFTKWDDSLTKMETNNIMQAYPDLDGIITHSNPRASYEAIQEMGRDMIPITWMGENGALRIWKEGLKEGLRAQAFTKPPRISAEALEVGIKALQGKPFEKYTEVPVHIITEAEIDEFYRPGVSDRFWTCSDMPNEKVKEIFE
jgi:ribose transport system substrate-binding protein